MRPLLFIVSLMSAAPALRGEEKPAVTEALPLQLKWQTGFRYVQRIEINQSGKLPSKGGVKNQHANITAEMVLSVRPHSKDDWRSLGVNWNAFSIDGSNGGVEFGYNSSKPSKVVDEGTAKAGNEILSYIGREFLLQIDPLGTISATPEFDAAVTEITKKAPHVAAPVKAFFSRTNITQLLRLGMLPAVPDKPVVIGGTWPFQAKFEIPVVGSLHMDGTCTMSGWVNRGGAQCCEIPVSGSLDFNSTLQASLMGLKDAEGKMTGAVWFDTDLGWARESVTTWDVTATLAGIASAQDGSPQFVPLKQTTRITLLRMETVK